jgi:hypothetical protein
MTDDDIRDMLRVRAQEATVSDEAWGRISARLGEVEQHKVVRHLPRRLAVAGVAAAAIAGTVVIANLPGPTTQVAQTTTTVVGPPLAPADVSAVRQAADDWVHVRVGNEVDRGTPEIATRDGDTVTVRFAGGKVNTEVAVRRSGEGSWEAVSATSDLVLVEDPTYDGSEVVATAVPAAEGELTTTYVVNTRDLAHGTVHVTHEAQPLGLPVSGATAVAIRVVLVTGDGTTALSEVPATILRDPATVTGDVESVWPATDEEGLASLQRQADRGRRSDLLDPVAVAGGYLTERFPQQDPSPTTFALGSFRQGDPSSGEVPYKLDVKADVDVDAAPDGLILVRRDGEHGIWHVHAVTSESFTLKATRGRGRIDLAFDGLDADSVDIRTRTTGGGSQASSMPVHAGGGGAYGILGAAGTRWVEVAATRGGRVVAIAVSRVE